MVYLNDGYGKFSVHSPVCFGLQQDPPRRRANIDFISELQPCLHARVMMSALCPSHVIAGHRPMSPSYCSIGALTSLLVPG